ncbi:uncharacterized protein AKAME5_002993200 [Lates japonicus]|uniref:Uncharacterized protein n=1 Tax=Lates japonicus TaxID=270547 RepID=A0AAD3R8N7_LATJO|nr:uncharacterized protein AKAME5_002993200 [Lates japonicus]
MPPSSCSHFVSGEGHPRGGPDPGLLLGPLPGAPGPRQPWAPSTGNWSPRLPPRALLSSRPQTQPGAQHWQLVPGGPRPSPRGERAQRALSPRPREAARYGRGVAVKLAAGAASHLRPEPFQADLEPVAAHHRRRKCARRGPASAGERSREGILPHRAAVPDPPS